MPSRTARTLRTPEKKEKFLATLRSTGNVSEAAKATGIGRQTAYDWKKEDPDFSADWDEAQKEGLDSFGELLEAEGYRRAVKGTLRPVYQKGEKVGEIREYSDTLLIFLLKGAKPNKYRDKVADWREALANAGVPQEEIHAIEQQFTDLVAAALAKCGRGSTTASAADSGGDQAAGESAS